jgi:predicted Zn-dependent peptidase
MLRKEVLDRGIKVVTEEMPQVRSVSVGVWIKNGSRNESEQNNGISHFIEHLLFKGTKKRTARQIARTLDRVGGRLNAFTGKELTCYYVQVLDKHLDLAIDLLSDILLNSLFKAEAIDKERRVIEEEIKRYEDTPEELIYDLFTQTIWSGHSLGQPILGKKTAIANLSRKDISGYFKKQYTPDNTIVSVAGNIKHQDVVGKINSSFRFLPGGSRLKTPKILRKKSQKLALKEKKDLKQVHLCLGVKGLPQSHKDKYVLATLNTILGGGMSSRLFQNIREKRGLAYFIQSSLSSYRDRGLLAVSLGTSPSNLPLVIELILKELDNLRDKPVKKMELFEAKEQLKGNLMLSLESTDARMSRLAGMEIYHRKLFTLDEVIQKIEEIRSENLQKLAARIFKRKNLTLAAIGSSLDRNKIKSWLNIND